ncbi:hypothetical protein [Campylobacter estrildidarum]|uniref:Uncharacterized protein n=1 Tax=Campylobacter estrildidarum TaxID=2510189 RepID=A0A4U7BL02_9BACT|nr:hypothetical protein [Campylobacter estrildidarum]TKX30810.1 hypothetical protein CQA69_04945 [Campylobacter estrildidarum]
MLFAIVAVFFIACGNGDKLVKFEYEKGDNKELFEKASNLVKEKYPDYNLYSFKSLKTMKSIENAKELYDRWQQIDAMGSIFGSKSSSYIKNILLEKNGEYKLIRISCYDARHTSLKRIDCEIDELKMK